MINICFKRHVSAQNWLEDNFSSLFYGDNFPQGVQGDLLFLCIMHSDLFSCACPRWPIILSVCIYVFVFVYFERWSISPTSKMLKLTNRFATNFEIHWEHFSDKFQMENKFSHIPDVVLHPLNLICQLHWAIWSLQKTTCAGHLFSHFFCKFTFTVTFTLIQLIFVYASGAEQTGGELYTLGIGFW